MANLYIMNDMNLVLDGMRYDADQTPIEDALLTAHFFDATSEKAITGASNASPIVITCTGHGFSTGNKLVIAHVLGNLAANGCWTITVINANSFSLDSSTGNGAYLRGGQAYKAINNGYDLSMANQVGFNGRYMAVIPRTLDRINGESSRCIVMCSNYNFEIERDHISLIRT